MPTKKQDQTLLYVGGIHDGILTEYLGGGSKIGEMIQFDEHIFQMGWFNHQL